MWSPVRRSLETRVARSCERKIVSLKISHFCHPKICPMPLRQPNMSRHNGQVFPVWICCLASTWSRPTYHHIHLMWCCEWENVFRNMPGILYYAPIVLPCLIYPFLLQLRHGKPAFFCLVRVVVQDSIVA